MSSGKKSGDQGTDWTEGFLNVAYGAEHSIGFRVRFKWYLDQSKKILQKMKSMQIHSDTLTQTIPQIPQNVESVSIVRINLL